MHSHSIDHDAWMRVLGSGPISAAAYAAAWLVVGLTARVIVSEILGRMTIPDG